MSTAEIVARVEMLAEQLEKQAEELRRLAGEVREEPHRES